MLRKFFVLGVMATTAQLLGCTSHRAPVDDYTQGSPARAVAPAATAARTGEHIVRRGDTLYSIAFQYGYAYQQVAAWNRINPPYTIYTGQRLRISPPGAPGVPLVSDAQATAPTRNAPAIPAVTPIPATRPSPVPPSQTAQSLPPSRASAPAPDMADAGLLPNGPIQWRWPSAGPVLRGFSPSEPGRRGIDIGGRSGQSVLAAAGGQVVYSGSGLIGYGQLIIIKHNKSLLSAYAYNRKLLVMEGEAVRVGQPIAEMGGNPGDKPMLHFEIRVDGKPVNPLQYLPKR